MNNFKYNTYNKDLVRLTAYNSSTSKHAPFYSPKMCRNHFLYSIFPHQQMNQNDYGF